MQQYADIYLSLNYCICFGHLSRPSSGVHKTVVAVSGTGHTVWGASFCKRDQNKDFFFGFYATLWDLSVPKFCRNILQPSSGWQNLVQVGAELTGGRKCCLSMKVGGNFSQPEAWNVGDGTGHVTTQKELQVTTITQSKNTQNCHQLNKTHCVTLQHT